MAIRQSQALPKPSTVAYLLANVERLTGAGAFTAQPAARTVFLHLCCHPGGNLPHPDKQSSWACPVASPHHKPADIAEATGLTPRGVEKALDWLASEGFINQDRGSKKRKSYGAATIVATHWLSDWKRTQFAMHPLSPAIGTQVATNELSSLTDGPTTPKRPRRTVAAKRSTCANTDDLQPSGMLKSAGEARDAPGECPVPVPRPGTGARRASVRKAGPTPIDDFPVDDCPIDLRHTARGGLDVDEEVARVMALLSDLPGWDTADGKVPA